MRIPFAEFIKNNLVLFDGAIGTELYNKGVFINSCYDELMEKNVEIIEAPTDKDMRYWKHRTLFFKDPENNILEIYAEIEFPEEI